MAEGRPLSASDLARILRIYLRIAEELPPDIEAGFLDDSGHVHFLADIGQKLRTSRETADLLRQLRESPHS